MTDIAGAYTAIKARVTAAYTGGLAVYYQGEEITLPDAATPFIFLELISNPGYVASFGAGRGSNRYRNEGVLRAYVFVPRLWNIVDLGQKAEDMAKVFRSYRDATISCFGATAHPLGEGESLVPPGLDSGASLYTCMMVETEIFYDQIG